MSHIADTAGAGLLDPEFMACPLRQVADAVLQRAAASAPSMQIPAPSGLGVL